MTRLIMSERLLIMSLVMAQIQVEALSCCQSNKTRNIYNSYRLIGISAPQCASMSGCLISDTDTCPSGWGYDTDIFKNSGKWVTVNEYSKLGCSTSVSGAMKALQNSDASEIVNGAVEQCAKACSTFCTKSSKTALETA